MNLFFLLFILATPNANGETAQVLGPFKTIELCQLIIKDKQDKLEEMLTRQGLKLDRVVGCYVGDQNLVDRMTEIDAAFSWVE